MKSELTDFVDLSPNNSGARKYNITRITPHVVVGEFDALTVAGWFNSPSRKASANYIIGKSGEVVLNVDENNRAWTSGNAENDNRSITIECSSDKNNHNALNEKVYDKLVLLCVDICKRYNKKKLVYIRNATELNMHVYNNDEMLLTKHNTFQNVACPDKWLEKQYENDFVTRVNNMLNGVDTSPSNEEKLYRVQVGAFKNKDNAITLVTKLKSLGFNDAFIKEG